MKSMIRRVLFGPFQSRDRGNGRWELTAGASHIYLTLAEGGTGNALTDAAAESLELEWRDEGVTVRVKTQGVAILEARSAIIHETQDRLYDNLPLAAFDPKARQFWRRVFRLMRIPGGRFLLRLMTRRKR